LSAKGYWINGESVKQDLSELMVRINLISVCMIALCLMICTHNALGQEGRNRFVVNVGWEINRNTIVGVLGYDFRFSKPRSMSFTPELNVYGGILTVSGSFKYCSPPFHGQPLADKKIF